ncbi:MAG: Wzz/FepE/Etk N-terminal domain-containing protein [Deltaproteobacteria bacterium]|nr:Wzz/FepE/Etk N-terminal domain-containing protein [Deltaproteobacteria bacterium]
MHEGHHPIDPDAQRLDYYEDEIELMDLLRVIWKWKYLILAGTLLCAVGAALISLNMTKIYRIDTVISPGVVKVEQGGKIIHIGSAQEIKSFVETGAPHGRVLKRLQVPDPEALPKSLKFDLKTPKGGNELKISYETASPEMGLQVLSELNRLLVEKYENLVRYYREEYDIQIRSKASEASKIDEKIDKAKNGIATVEAEMQADVKSKTNKIQTIKAQIAAKKAQITNLQEQISDVELEIGRISKNTDMLIEERNKFLATRKTEDDILSAVIYSNTIQQNISYLNSLRSAKNNTNGQIYQERAAVEGLENAVKDLEAQIVTLQDVAKYKIQNLQSQLKALESEKEYIRDEIKNLEFKREYVQNIQLVQPPRKSLFPIKPKIRLNTVLAAVVGLFITVFLAFFIEYISKYKSREAEDSTPE